MNAIFVLLSILPALDIAYIVVNFGLPYLIVQLAKVDAWWSPYRTQAPPGEMFIIVKGDPHGPFDSIIESVLTHEYDNATHEFKEELTKHREKTGYLANLGVEWIGFFRYLFRQEVGYDKWEKLPNSTNFGMVSKSRPGPSIFFRYNMAVEITAAETKGNFPVNAIIVYTVEILKPVQAFFLAGGWAGQVAAAVINSFNKSVSDMDINELREEHKLTGGNTILEKIKALGGKNGNGPHDPRGLFPLFGVVISDARFVQYDLVSGDRDAEMLKATRALEIATLEADADAKRGEGERRKREERARGIEAEVKAWGSDSVGAQIAMAEAIKEAKPNVLGGNIMAAVDSNRKEGGK